jgi:hypothetical protein
MLTIDINKNYFALDTKFSIRISGVNPACQMDKIRSEAGLGINIPVNEINRGLLGAPERFSKYFPAGDPGLKFPGCSIRFGGALQLSGSLVVIKATSESYECWLQSDLGVMGEELQNKKINEFDWPTAQDFNRTEQAWFPDNFDYGVIQFRNPGFWEGKGKEINQNISYLDENGVLQTKQEMRGVMSESHFKNFDWKINNYIRTELLITQSTGCVISPFLYLGYIMRKSLQLNNFYVKRNDFQDSTYEEGFFSLPFFKSLQIYNNYNILSPVYSDPISETFRSWDFDLQEFKEYSWKQITGFTGFEIKPFDYASLLPKISFKDFLLSIQNTLNFIFRFRNDMCVDIIDRNAILTQSTIDINEYRINEFAMGERKNVTLKFLPSYDEDDSKFSDFEDLSDRASDFADAVDTYADLIAISNPDFGELRLVNDENKIYEYKWTVKAQVDALQREIQYDVLGWELVSVGPQPFLFGTMPEREEIQSSIGPLQIKESETILNAFNYDVMQKGNLSAMRSTWEDFSFRLIDGRVVGNTPKCLFWDGPRGLFKNRWETWANFWKTRHPFEADFQLPLNVLVYINENITSPFRTDEGAFIIDEMETEFGLNVIGKTKIKGYKI